MSISIEQVEHNGVLDAPGVQRQLRKLAGVFPLAGNLLRNKAVGTAQLDDGAVGTTQLATAIQEALIPAGTVLATARSAAPTGFLLCDGSAVSRTTYATLFSAIGTTYGAGNGTTTFNLPDLRGRVPAGVDGAAGRLAANDALGNSGGVETVTLTVNQIPAHDHPLALNFAASGSGDGNGAWRGQTGVLSDTDIPIKDRGGGQSHTNLQPYQIVNWMVKT